MRVIAKLVTTDYEEKDIVLDAEDRGSYWLITFRTGCFGIIPMSKILEIQIMADGVKHHFSPHLPFIRIAKQENTPASMRPGKMYVTARNDDQEIYAEHYIDEDTGNYMVSLQYESDGSYWPAGVMHRSVFEKLFHVKILPSQVFELAND